uniref:Periplasmic nitrate reductase n=1 Tax=Anthurium amnicola TaxID=1678845 RepID=A0A1D1XRE9_9ARAE
METRRARIVVVRSWMCWVRLGTESVLPCTWAGESFYLGSTPGDHTLPARRQPHQRTEIQTGPEGDEQSRPNRPRMASSYRRGSPIIAFFVGFLLVLALVLPAQSAPAVNSTFRAADEIVKLRRVRAHLKKLNKPSVKTIQSPEGDLIDCVPSHLQPAFDHPKLRGQRPLDPPKRPRAVAAAVDPATAASFQSWAASGESCPEGTVPIRRTVEVDVLRASSIRRFGRKPAAGARRDSTSGGHEHAVGYVIGDQYYGAKASLNVWAPKVTSSSEFSLSQIWMLSGSFGDDLNTIEAGWQVSPELYGDDHPRFFTYWTSDAYQTTGCYNLLCSGFVQTNNKFAVGTAISPISTYDGGQFDISLLIWKDPRHGNWWLEFGSGLIVGYWPAFLFSHLVQHASMVQFGGEVVNDRPAGGHTATQMGSGRFAVEGFGRASYFRNLQVVDWDNSLVPPASLRILADHPGCYDIHGGVNNVWGSYFYFGGPGRNQRCSY